MTKLQWRRTWFQVHKWIGLALAILIVPLCLSGAALVWDEALDHALNPQRYAVTGTARLSPQAYLDAAAARLKSGERVAQVQMGEGDDPVVVSAAGAGRQARPGPPRRTQIYLDPPTARVLDVGSNGQGLVRFLHVLHGSLQIPGGWGRSIVGWIGVAMTLSAFTGVWLWWPRPASLRRAFRWRRYPDLSSNMHQSFGSWIALPLFVLSLTGAWISFPQFFGALVGQGRPPGPDRMAQARARPVERTRLPVADAVARARTLAGGELRQVTWPTEKKPDWTVQLKPARGAPVQVSVADDDGVAALTPVPAGQGGVARLMRRIHDGTGMGWLWQGIIFLGGLIPAMLAVTGVIMWWRARGWKARLAERQRRGPMAGSAA